LQIFDLPEPGLERDVFLAGGDDYELVFTAAPARTEEILAIAQRLELPLREIGIVLAGTANTGKVLDQCGIDITPERRGFDHFGSADPAA
jgi:thiamine-monophosphate kinase